MPSNICPTCTSNELPNEQANDHCHVDTDLVLEMMQIEMNLKKQKALRTDLRTGLPTGDSVIEMKHKVRKNGRMIIGHINTNLVLEMTEIARTLKVNCSANCSAN